MGDRDRQITIISPAKTGLTGDQIMLTCYRCGLGIKGRVTHHNPSNLSRTLGDFERAFHPSCYVEEDREAELKLFPDLLVRRGGRA